MFDGALSFDGMDGVAQFNSIFVTTPTRNFSMPSAVVLQLGRLVFFTSAA